jgi:hypothetical protein
MRKPTRTLITCLLFPSVLAACAVDNDDGAGDDPDPDTEATALCLAPPTPPPLDAASWILDNHENRVAYASNYGTGECASYTRGATNVEWMSVTATDLPTDEDECEDARLVVRKYRQSSTGGWSYVGSVARNGAINEFGVCALSMTYDAHTRDGVRLYATHRQTTCSGMWCLTEYGRPLTFTARGYEP